MNSIRRIFTISVMAVTILSMSVVVVPDVGAAASAGDLIKMDGLSSVYYLAADGKRYVFPNEKAYFSWYSDFSGVVTIPQSELESYPLGANVTVRPGTKLVKITTNPKVYAPLADGHLVAVPDEATAAALYGANWAKRIIDVPDAFFTNYTIDSGELSSAAYPEGSLIKMSDDPAVYYVDADGMARKIASEAAFLANRFKWDDVITAASGFTLPTLGDEITGSADTSGGLGIIDTSQGGGGGTGLPPGAGTGLTVALASDTPAAGVIPSSASNAVFAKYNFTASNDGAITISGLSFKRSGVGATGDFKNLYLYEGDTRLTNGRSVNSSTNLATFSNLGISVAAGTTKTLSLTADIAASKSGSHAFELNAASAVSTTATVSGSFPVKGNTMSLNATNVGRVVVTQGSNPANITAGSGEVEVSSFTAAISSTEDAEITKLTLYHAGTVSNSNITNLKLKQGGTTIATAASVPSSGRVIFVLDSPYKITKGNSKKFYVYADISSDSRAAQTVKFYMEANADISATGLTYSFPLTVAIGGTDSAGSTSAGGTFDGTSTYYTTADIEAGDITVSTSGPSAGNLAVNSDDVNLLNFSITSQSNAEIRSLQLELHSDNFGDSDLDIADTTATGNYITDIKITDTGSNTVVWGAVDITSFVDAGGATNDGVGYAFTDVVTFTAGETRNFKVTCDISSSVTAGSDLIAVIGDEADANTFTATAVKSTDTNTYITSIVPGTFTSGNTQTFQSAALALSRSSVVPVAQSIVRGATEVQAASIVFDASASGADVKVTQIKLSGYVDAFSGTAGLTKDQTVASEGTLAVKDVTTNVRIYERASGGTLTQLGTAKAFDTSGEATYSSLSWVIPKESSKTLVVKLDIPSGISTLLDYGEDNLVRVAVDITTAADDVTAESADKGVTLTVTGDLPNVATGTTGAQLTVNESGTIISADGTEPRSTWLLAGTPSADFDEIRFTSTIEDMKVTKLRVKLSSGTIGNLESVVLTYTDSAGVQQTPTQGFVGNNADFTGLDIFVKKDEYRTVKIAAKVKTVTDGATPGSAIALIIDGSTGFEAVGSGNSSTKLTTISTNGATAGNAMYIVKGKPTFATQSLDSTTLSSGVAQTIYKFTVTAAAGSDIALKQLPFTINVSDGDAGMYVHSIRLKRTATNGIAESTNMYATFMNITGDGYLTSLDNGILNEAYADVDYPWGDNANSRTAACIFDTNDSFDGTTVGDSKGEEVVQSGTSKTFELIATTGGTVSTGDSISVYMPSDSYTTLYHGLLAFEWDDPDNIIDVNTAGNGGDYVWSDNASGTSHEDDYTATMSGDWYNGAYFTQTTAVSRTK